MTIQTTRAEWDRWQETKRWVMFGEGVTTRCNGFPDALRPPVEPHDWMVEAAAPCDTCDGTGFVNCLDHLRQIEARCDACWTVEVYPCPDCLDGKRRIAVGVPCDCYEPQPHCHDGLVTVATVVVEWGPLVVSSEPLDVDYIQITADGEAWYHEDMGGHGWRSTRITLPPGIDPTTLVGQYAVGGKLV